MQRAAFWDNNVLWASASDSKVSLADGKHLKGSHLGKLKQMIALNCQKNEFWFKLTQCGTSAPVMQPQEVLSGSQAGIQVLWLQGSGSGHSPTWEGSAKTILWAWERALAPSETREVAIRGSRAAPGSPPLPVTACSALPQGGQQAPIQEKAMRDCWWREMEIWGSPACGCCQVQPDCRSQPLNQGLHSYIQPAPRNMIVTPRLTHSSLWTMISLNFFASTQI